MDYELKYPITQRPGEYILLSYTKGFREVIAEYKDKVLFEGISGKDLKRGVKMTDADLGTVEMKFAKEKLVVNVIVDGYHSSINRDHPKKRLANVASLFWILMGFTCLTFLLVTYMSVRFPLPSVIASGPLFTAMAIGIYAITAVNLRKGKSDFFWLGLGMFVIRILLTLVAAMNDSSITESFGFTIGLILRVAFLVGLLFCIPLVLKHRKYEPFMKFAGPADTNLIDTGI
jgi:hypothetical protein